MGTASALAKACLARSTKLSSIKPLRFSSERGSYFDYAEASNLGLYVHMPACSTADSAESSGRRCGNLPSGASEKNKSAVLAALLAAIDSAGSAAWKTTFDTSARRLCGLEPTPPHEKQRPHNSPASPDRTPYSREAAASRDRKTITTLFLKGNTTLLGKRELESVMRAVHDRFVITHGVGFELPAADATAERFRMLRELGIAHLVISISPSPRTLECSLNGSGEEHIGALAALKEVAFDTVSLALAFAQPGQTSQQLQYSIDRALASGANHISLRPFNSREAKRIEAKCGAKPAPLVEFGCAATTLAGGKFKVNAYSISEYGRRLEAGKRPAAATLKIVERERILRYLLWAAHGQARSLLAQARLLHGIERPKYR